MLRQGSWWLNSKSCPKWNASGEAILVGGFRMPPECEAKLEELKKKLGEPPDDLTYGYMKD